MSEAKLTYQGVELATMVESRIELPPAEELAEWLRQTRRRHSITQTELAERAEVSPSQISRIEGRQGGTAYMTMYRLQQELLTMISAESVPQVSDVLAEKHNAVGGEYELVTVTPEDTVATASERMRNLQISQLPVLTNEKEAVGRVTERDLMSISQIDDSIKKYIGPPFPAVPANTPVAIARTLLEKSEAILVTPSREDTAEDAEDNYIGILTPSDLAGKKITNGN